MGMKAVFFRMLLGAGSFKIYGNPEHYSLAPILVIGHYYPDTGGHNSGHFADIITQRAAIMKAVGKSHSPLSRAISSMI
jgi:hypothetical protein